MLSETTTAAELSGHPEQAEQHYNLKAMLELLVRALLPALPAASVSSAKLKDLSAFLDSGTLDNAALAAHRTALESCRSVLAQDITRLRNALESGAAGPPPDSATGLPGPAAAQQLITQRVAEGHPTFAAILVLDQLRALNARFGRAVGDEVLKLAAQGLALHLDGSGILHRWRGPAFLVVCTKGQRQADDLEERIRKLVVRRLESTINVESRSIHVKFTFTWRLEHVALSAEAMARDFDDFVSEQTNDTSKMGR